MDREFDLIEIIEQKDNVVTSSVYTKKNIKEVEEKLRQMFVPIRFDLHNVMDLLPQTYNIKYPACIISFVGRNSEIRSKARNEIMERIKQNQILYGILIFKRIDVKDNSPLSKEKLIGSKAWVNLLLSKNISSNSFFLDDSIDHIRSTSSLKIPNLTTIQIHKLKHLEDTIQSIYEKLDNSLEK